MDKKRVKELRGHRQATGTNFHSRRSKLGKKAMEELQLLQSRIQLDSTAELVWTRLLTKEEKALFGNSFKRAWRKHRSTLGIATHVWKCSQSKALLRIAREFGTLSDATLRWLAKELGEPRETKLSPTPDSKPQWKRTRGRLYWNGEEIRFIRSISRAVNIVKVLDAFESGDWPDSVENPPEHLVAEDLRETVRSLNSGMKHIRFETAGMAVRWRTL